MTSRGPKADKESKDGTSTEKLVQAAKDFLLKGGSWAKVITLVLALWAFSGLDGRIDTQDHRIDAQDIEIANNDEQIQQIGAEVTTLKTDVDTIQVGVDDLTSELVKANRLLKDLQGIRKDLIEAIEQSGGET